MTIDDATLWPLLGLRVAGVGLELRWPHDELLLELARLATLGVHDEGFMPFHTPWTRGTPVDVGRKTLQYHWGQRSKLSAEDWSLPLVVLREGHVLGTQEAMAKQYPVTRTAETGSWLGREFHGQGVGTTMRLLILHLLFEGLGAQTATTAAFVGNEPSIRVTRKLGYRENGTAVHASEGTRVTELRFQLTRTDWEARPEWMRPEVSLEGVEAVREQLGIV